MGKQTIFLLGGLGEQNRQHFRELNRKEAPA